MLKVIVNYLVLAGTFLAVPVLLACLYDKFVAEPKRGRDEDGEPRPPTGWLAWAWSLLPFTLIAVAWTIGFQKVLGWAQVLVVPMSWLAVPLAAVSAYDKWVLQPQRPRKRNGEPKSGPWYFGLANWLLVFAVFAVVVRIGVPVVFGKIKELAEPLSYAAVPIGLWCFIDSWFLAPRRQVAAGNIKTPDPALTRAAYFVLPVLIVAVIVRMITAETLDFSLVLFLLSVGTGAVWAIDHFLFRPKRVALLAPITPQPPPPNPEELAKAKTPPKPTGPYAHDPGTVDYARSFFPVAVVVLLVRAFIFEPFRIPSDSMMPTLLDGDFIVVNKYAYGLRWPVLNTKIADLGQPQRGDIVVFRYPPDPKVNFIKRLVGLPGDTVEVHDDQLVINGETIALTPVPPKVNPEKPDEPPQDQSRYTDGCYVDMRHSLETIGGHTHRVMSCRSENGLIDMRGDIPGFDKLAACDRKQFAIDNGRKLCRETPPSSGMDLADYPRPGRPVWWTVVPPGHYVFIGDNRDNSADSRSWGLVPEENLVGKATRIWFNFDLQRTTVVDLDRIGQSIE